MAAQCHFNFSGTLGILMLIVHLLTSQPGGYQAYGKWSMGKLKMKQANKTMFMQIFQITF